jgi:putative transposase
MNRAVDRRKVFQSAEDYAQMEQRMLQAKRRVPTRILGYSLMPNHLHALIWPREDGELPRFMHYLTTTHAMDVRKKEESIGNGHVYKERYKCVPVQDDEHFLTACRYVEANALKAGLVVRAEDWQWSSLHARLHRPSHAAALLDEWPVRPPPDYLGWVNEVAPAVEASAIRRATERGEPFGDAVWAETVRTTPPSP